MLRDSLLPMAVAVDGELAGDSGDTMWCPRPPCIIGPIPAPVMDVTGLWRGEQEAMWPGEMASSARNGAKVSKCIL